MKDYKFLELRETCKNHQVSLKLVKKRNYKKSIIQAFSKEYHFEDHTISEDRLFTLFSNVHDKMSSTKGILKDSTLTSSITRPLFYGNVTECHIQVMPSALLYLISKQCLRNHEHQWV
ncbi:unnamed protein product [Lepeophtheirus salmonis]|uniref:(salmon louse) hypothetical protein n=1 Tax=Lepeophtheirus salmonis TaxID=72036 RepID=A0A7R8CIP4_LEPSM|nr:unnamed protein product [Lepeophtheirus salmonis]CAF2834124.1 unnamed protein product [Lepeophtheirus salmonis]